MKSFEMFDLEQYLHESGQSGVHSKTELSADEEKVLAKKSKLPAKLDMGELKVEVSYHAQARAVQRRNDLDASDWKDIAKRMRAYIRETGLESGKYMMYSKEYNQSVVVSWNGKKLSWITVFPKGINRVSHKQSAEGQTLQVMESVSVDEFENSCSSLGLMAESIQSDVIHIVIQ
jgi:hypothetical protein